MRPDTRCFSAFAVCLGVACGGDRQGTGTVRVDSGLDEGRGGAGSVGDAANTGGDATRGSGNVADSATSDAAFGAAEGGSTNDVGGGNSSADGGTGAPSGTQDATAGDAVAIFSAEGGALCGPCSQGQQCDPTLGCVNCTMDSQCPASARFCFQGSCVQCTTSADCGSGTTPSCYPANHTCGAACTSSQQCTQQDNGTPICDMSTGACVGCLTPGNCPTSQSICDPATGQCVQCTSRANCAGTSTPACARDRCVQCASNTDCSGATPYCASGGDNAWHCVQCVQNAQCPPGMPSCNGGTCGKSGG